MDNREGRSANFARVISILGLATIWPSFHNQLLYPITLTFNKTGAPSATYFYIVYALIALATCVVLIAAREGRVHLLTNRWAVLAVDAIGILGLVMIAACDFDTLLSTALVGFGAGFCAVSMPVLFIFWSWQVLKESGQVAVDVLVSYLVASLLVMARLALGIHTVVFSVALGVLSCVLVMLSRPTAPPQLSEGAAALKALPLRIIVPSLIAFVLLEACIIYINPAPAAYDYPSQFRITIYAAAAVFCAVFIAVYHLGRETPYRSSLVVFALLATGAIVSMVVTAFLRPSYEDMGNYPLIGCAILIGMFVWLLVLDMAKVKHLSIVLAAALYLALFVFAANLLGAISLDRGLFADHSNTILLVICVVSAVVIAIVINFLFARFLLHPHTVRKRPGARSASQELTAAASTPDADTVEQDAAESIPEAIPHDPLEMAFDTVKNTYGLSDRQMDVVRLAYHNRTARRIGEELFISEGTVKTHLKTIYKRLDIHSKQDLIDLVDSYL